MGKTSVIRNRVFSAEELDEEILKLEDTFKFKNSDEIKDYIHKKPRFIPFFEELVPLLKDYFPNESFELRYAQDYEEPDLERLIIKVVFDYDIWSSKEIFNAVNGFIDIDMPLLRKYNLVDDYALGAF